MKYFLLLFLVCSLLFLQKNYTFVSKDEFQNYFIDLREVQKIQKNNGVCSFTMFDGSMYVYE